jgi:hypothetical protein
VAGCTPATYDRHTCHVPGPAVHGPDKDFRAAAPDRMA